MTFTTPSRNPKASHHSTSATSGFTLVEIMVSTALSVGVMAAILTVAIFITRSSYRAASYAEMDTESRKGLEYFARDTRMAKEIVWHSATSITLTIPVNSTGGTQGYRYTYNATRGTFSRQLVAPVTGTEDVLISGITTFEFKGFQIDGAELSLSDLSAAANRTKQIQLSLKAVRSRAVTADSSTKVLSARFILRNKRVTI